MTYEEPTRRGILKDYLEIERGQLRAISKSANMLEPKPGREARWEMMRKRCKLIEDMIQALECEPVRAAMSDWQRLVMEEDKLGKNHQMML